MTPTAIFGLSAGANAVKTASGWALAPFSAVPVFPAISRPFSRLWLNWEPVPSESCTTAIIICFS